MNQGFGNKSTEEGIEFQLIEWEPRQISELNKQTGTRAWSRCTDRA